MTLKKGKLHRGKRLYTSVYQMMRKEGFSQDCIDRYVLALEKKTVLRCAVKSKDGKRIIKEVWI